jgi:outer membrane protein assembly factor BamE (lipoprotein component of BamABCDE complex)
MASIFLKRRELSGGLPRVCVVCGQRGHLTEVTLRHQSGLLGFSSGVRIVTCQEATLPLCPAHEDYFERPNRFALAGFAVLALLMMSAALSFFLISMAVFAVFFLLFVVGVVAFGLVNFFLGMSRTRAAAIEEHGVWLAQVAEEFVEALEHPNRDIVAQEQPRRGRRAQRGVPVLAWLAGAAAVLLMLVGGGIVAFFLVSGLGGPAAGTSLSRERFERVKPAMSEQEVVSLLGPPVGVEGPPAQANEPGASRTLHWDSGSIRLQVTLTDGKVTSTRGVFDNPAEATPAAWTEAHFARLRRDMPRAEVRSLFGPPQEITAGDSATDTWRQGSDVIVAWFRGDRLLTAYGTLGGKAVALNAAAQSLVPGKGARAGGKVTEENFRKLRAKMTTDEVRGILGAPDDDGGGIASTWREGNNTIQVHFKDGRVMLATGFINGQVLAVVDLPQGQ